MSRFVAAVSSAMLCAAVVWAGEPEGWAPAPVAQTAQDFLRNVALGAVLVARPGADAELAELRTLAERGPRLAREAVALDPESAEAHYWLGSWLLYGYRTVDAEHIAYSPEVGEETKTETRVAPALTEDPAEGLAALRKATELAPKRGDYLLDYAAALVDYGRSTEAMPLLTAAWDGQPGLTVPEKMRAAVLLSDIDAARGNTSLARDWAYAALDADPENAGVVDHLRWLDEMVASTVAERAAAPRVEAAAPEPTPAAPGGPRGGLAAIAGARRAPPTPPPIPLNPSLMAHPGQLPQCPFDLRVGKGIRLTQDSTEPDIRYYDLDFRANTVAQIDAGRWSMAGAHGAFLHGKLKRPQSLGGGGSVVSAGSLVQSGSAIRTQSPRDSDVIWHDQPFEVYVDGTLLGRYNSTAEFVAARGY
jgi:hypothetical protein